MASPRPPPELIPDAVTEVLLRVPPDDPAGLVRAAAACKLWRRILAGPAFRRRYRELHGGRRHMLGFLRRPYGDQVPGLAPIGSFRPAAAADQRTWCALDCRQGRALFYDYECGDYVVWDPVTGHQQRMPDEIPEVYTQFAVVCVDAASCDHTACSGGPFLLVCAALNTSKYGGSRFTRAHACSFSSETRESSVSIYINLNGDECFLEGRPAAHVGDSLYFIAKSGMLLRYRYGLLLRPSHKSIPREGIYSTDVLSVIEPPRSRHLGSVFVMTGEDGGLSLASLHLHKLSLWARETGPDGGAGWVQRRTIDLKALLPTSNPVRRPCLTGVAEGGNFIFVSTLDGVFTIELESLQVRKVCEMYNVEPIYPFVAFYTETLLQKLASGKLLAPAGDQ